MTIEEREEAIEVFEGMVKTAEIHETFTIPRSVMIRAQKNALEALKAEPCGDCDKWEEDKTACQKCGEPCEDAVSREAVLELIEKWQSMWDTTYSCAENLPSVTPSIPTSTDCVSREAAIEELKHRQDYYSEAAFYTRLGLEIAISVMKSLPPVTPASKAGKWIKFEENIYRCDLCGRTVHKDILEDMQIDYPYCHCGAKMEGESE